MRAGPESQKTTRYKDDDAQGFLVMISSRTTKH